MELLGEAKWGIFSFMLEMISPGYKNGVGMERGNKDAECIHESTLMPSVSCVKSQGRFQFTSVG